MNQRSIGKMLDLKSKTKFGFSNIFHLNYFAVSMSFSKVSTRFNSSIYTIIITNPVCDFLIKMHKHMGLFTYPFFNNYILRKLYHICLDYFSSYEDHYNLIEYMLQGFVLLSSCNLNPSKNFMRMSLSMDPYKYAMTTFVRLLGRFRTNVQLYPTSFIL